MNSDTTESNSETVSPYINKGWVTSWKYGFSFAFNVTQIDRSTVTSIRNYGVSGVYFRPYYEKTKTINSSLVILIRLLTDSLLTSYRCTKDYEI